jgi:hypothetical protein
MCVFVGGCAGIVIGYVIIGVIRIAGLVSIIIGGIVAIILNICNGSVK